MNTAGQVFGVPLLLDRIARAGARRLKATRQLNDALSQAWDQAPQACAVLHASLTKLAEGAEREADTLTAAAETIAALLPTILHTARTP